MFFVGQFLVFLCIFLWILWWIVTRSRGHPLPPAYPGELPIIGHVHHLMTDTTMCPERISAATFMLDGTQYNVGICSSFLASPYSAEARKLCALYMLWLRGGGIAQQQLELWETVQLVAMDSLSQGGVIYCKFGKICYFITDPEDALKVANTCLEKHFVYGFARNWLGKGLITSTGSSDYHHHRKLLNPAFMASVVHTYLEVFNEQSKQLLKDIEPHVGKGQCDILPQIKEFTLRTICLNAFGQSDFKGSEFFTRYLANIEKILKILVNRFQNVWQYSEFLYSLWLKKEEDKVVKTINDVADGVIQKYRRAINEATLEKSYKPILEHILESTDKRSLTDLEIREELNTIILAGFETTSNALIYTLVLLGSHPEVQEKLHEEVIQVLGADSDVAKYDLQKLIYTDATIKESLRLLPTVAVIGRYIDKDVELKNCTLRAGSDCFLMLYGINRHSSWGPDAEQFKPERWLDPSSLPENSNAFSAFSFGKRFCIGKAYAMTSMKVALVHLVRKYRWTADLNKLKCKIDMTIQPVTGHEIILQRRN